MSTAIVGHGARISVQTTDGNWHDLDFYDEVSVRRLQELAGGEIRTIKIGPDLEDQDDPWIVVQSAMAELDRNLQRATDHFQAFGDRLIVNALDAMMYDPSIYRTIFLDDGEPDRPHRTGGSRARRAWKRRRSSGRS